MSRDLTITELAALRFISIQPTRVSAMLDDFAVTATKLERRGLVRFVLRSNRREGSDAVVTPEGREMLTRRIVNS